MKNWQLALLHLPFLGILIYLAASSPSVGGDGDTIMHYFLVEQAQRDPQFFFNLWGKPFFTLFAYPFAVGFGFVGIKVFNVLCGTGAVFIASLIAKRLNKKYYYLIPVLAFLTPAFPFYLLSGLTEPFAALVLATIVLLFIHKQPLPAYILISFLPYCRSEAKIFLLLFLLYGLVQKHYKYLPLLAFGSIVFAIAGSFVKGTPMWIFESTYAAGPSVYGSGPWLHFVNRIFVMLALPSFLLLCLGLLRSFYKIFTNGNYRQSEMWLIPGLFLAMFSAHTTVWALGIYASAGLDRVLLIVFPMAWVLMIDGLILMVLGLRERPKIARAAVGSWLVFQIVIFSTSKFTHYFFKQGTQLTNEQKFLYQEIVPYLKAIEQKQGLHLITDEAYLGVALNKNPKDPRHYANWFPINANKLEALTDSTQILWDDKVVPVHQGLTLEDMRNKPYLKEVKHWQTPNKGKHYVLFQPADSIAKLKTLYPSY